MTQRHEHGASEHNDPAKGSSNYRDRPTDDGKHGDGADEPTPALPGAQPEPTPAKAERYTAQ
jgi:hypothetical protein